MPKTGDGKNVIIIGGGIGGLAAACLLGQAGCAVTLLEARSQLGGRAGRLQAEGFTFDSGPSWYLMPDVYDRFFGLLGKSPADYLRLTKLSPAYRVFFESADPVTITGDEPADAATFERLEAGAGQRLTAYLDSAESIYHMSMKSFLYSDLRPTDIFRPQVMKSGPELLNIARRSIDSFVGSRFSDSRLRQILEYPAVFLGSSPFTAPALYHLMSYLDFRQGVYYPQGGIYTIIEALESLAAANGVEIITDKPVGKIEVANGSANGIRLQSGESLTADVVISNADLHYTQTELLDERHRDYPERYWQRRETGPSALLLYLGVRGTIPQLQHHNLLFADNWRGNFDAIFKDKTWPSPASMYVCKASATDPATAPAGHENLFVLVPLPAKTDISQKQIEEYTGRYLDQLAMMSGIADLRQRIVYQHAYAPDDFADDLHAWNGTALGLSHRLSQSAFFRPSIKSKKVNGLYYVGANVQPGIGMPMCLISAELVASDIIGKAYVSPGAAA